jgi:hypothetical protein
MRTTLIALAAAACTAPGALAQELIANGGFESSFTGWTAADQLGSDGSFTLQTGAASPPACPSRCPRRSPVMTTSGRRQPRSLPGHPVPGGITAARFRSRSTSTTRDTCASFRGWAASGHRLPGYQPAGPHRLIASANPFSTAPSDVLLNLFQTSTSTPATLGYTMMTTDVTAFLQARAGQTVRLRFAEVDNVNFFNMGVDNVSLAIPSPAAAGLLGAGALFMARRRRAR